MSAIRLMFGRGPRWFVGGLIAGLVIHDLYSPCGVVRGIWSGVAPPRPAVGSAETKRVPAQKLSSRSQRRRGVQHAARTQVAASEPRRECREILLAEAQRLFAGKEAAFVDVRARADFDQGHVPGALNGPGGLFEGGFLRLEGLLSKARPVVVYGAGSREVGRLGEELKARGFWTVLLYPQGWQEWSDAGLPRQKGSPDSSQR